MCVINYTTSAAAGTWRINQIGEIYLKINQIFLFGIKYRAMIYIYWRKHLAFDFVIDCAREQKGWSNNK